MFSIKSNNVLMNGIYFLTPLSYSINVIENTDDEQFPLSKKSKMKPIYDTCDWVVSISTEFTILEVKRQGVILRELCQ